MATIAIPDTRNIMPLDPADIVEKHMKALQADLSSLVENVASDKEVKVKRLQKELDDTRTIIAYLRRQTRETEDELADTKKLLASVRDERLRDAERMNKLERRVVCLVDGDGSVFSLSLIARGRTGGSDAATRLTEGIKQYFATEQFQLHVWIFVNKSGLSEALRRNAKEDARAQLDNFIHGFNQAAGRFMMIDVGQGKEAADAKIRACLEAELKLVETSRIIFAGCHDNGYISALRPPITDGNKDKLVLLPAHKDMAAGFPSLELPVLRIPGLFELNKLGELAPPTPPSSPAQRAAVAASYTAAVQAQPTAARSRRYSASERRARHLDPNKPMSKQDPPPCNLFYLTDYCKHGDQCVFGHDYLLKPEHLEEMRENAKKSACAAINRGEVCPYGDDCVLGHKCPQGPRCHYFKVGRCKFTGPGMHSAE
ncbi:uncharacterized protein PHACADRAFT_249875 [Phanerochaete carnosa HHB-10118-sp]|uniref:C3H1-type domain-containing protein n=1 Tax=Phanerochaete carnosa (strain HHB-10118-sp) TaxID=650164 RepID=K5X963_PHACS|nr:uncharacterized protein PHACADRAFT_249875 [Phanerochaete carnosa HHB-10118-sp]EKM59407.1 hypothetical protein PHACADRAFT_249875 [Phanerochaete carnosa HHB-10118-sp]